MNLCYEWSGYKSNISAKQRQELFYILFDEQLLVFTQEGNNIRSIFRKEGKPVSEFLFTFYFLSGYNRVLREIRVLDNPTSFCIDEAGNIIVTENR